MDRNGGERQVGPDSSDPSSEEYDAILRAMARAPEVPQVDDLVGVVVDGKYRVDAPLGHGGMGTVYVATHVGTGRAVALKVLVPELTSNDGAVERFRREARAAGQMRHANVVDVTDFGFAERGGQRLAYLVMELLRGQTLRAVLAAERRLPLGVAIDVLDQTCAAVAQAHARGILHRDIKPENIHLEPDARGGYRVKVLDFGIAKLLPATATSGAPPPPAHASPPVVDTDLAATLPAGGAAFAPTPSMGSGDRALTELGAVIGTPRYMAPEQWLGREVDARADVYSLGVVAYEMLAGELPFSGDGRSIAMEHVALPPAPLAEKAPSVPRWIARAVEAALAKDPSGRPPSVSAFAAALRAGTETTGKLLRRSIALCLEHYWLFFRRTSIVTIPTLVIAAISLASSLLARADLISSRVDMSLAMGLVRLLLLLGPLAMAPVVGLLVPLAADLEAAGRTLRQPLTVTEFWRVLRGSLPSTLVMIGIRWISELVVLALVVKLAHLDYRPLPMRLASVLATQVLACAALAPFAVTAPVVTVERLRGLAPLRRSAALVRPLFRTAFGVTLVCGLLFLTLDMSLNLAAAALAHAPLADAYAGGERVLIRSTAWRAACVLETLLRIVVWPFCLVPLALLYLRAREAEGDPVTVLDSAG